MNAPPGNPDKNQALSSLLDAFGVDSSQKRISSFAFSTKVPPPSWTAYSMNAAVPFFLISAEGSRATQIYAFASGINKEAFVLLADLEGKVVLIIRRPGREGDPYLRLVLQKQEDFERAVGILRRLNLVSDSLTAHAHLSDAVELLRVGAEGPFVNLGLFSSYFLRERMPRLLSERGRKVEGEASSLFDRFGGEIPTDNRSVTKVLTGLGYRFLLLGSEPHQEYRLFSGPTKLDAIIVVTDADSLDTKKSQEVVPSYQAVSALKDVHWVLLTNGRLWRLYSSRVNSSSTNYFEIDLEGITSNSDPRLQYFVSLFSAEALIPKEQGSDLESVFDGGLRHAQEIKGKLSSRIFEGQLFLNLVRAVVGHSNNKVYQEEELKSAKSTSLRLLYRILFVLYAESRNLLPIGNPSYDKISLEGKRTRLAEYEKTPEGVELWEGLRSLFRTIEEGDVKAGVPVYDGELFRKSPSLDDLPLKNRYLTQAVKELTEMDGKSIDYQNLDVQHLGSLYEALLEYDVRQAEEDLVVYKDGTLDAAYAADIKAKPKPFVEKGELYLSSKGFARKGTGSYYTPDELVKFLVKNGLQVVLDSRRKTFEAHIIELNTKKSRDQELEKVVVDDLLGIRVVDPAMGSGHFLVAAVDHITSWIMERLKEHPEAPLARIIDEDRERVLKTQKEKGIAISEELLSDSIILKRLVMKRCVYGVDINPLAVELAKLSLWLDSFTIGTPLTFLDHHIRVGDSLVGLWMKNLRSKASLEGILDGWLDTVSEVGEDLSEKVSMPPDLTLEEVEESRRIHEDDRRKTEPARMTLDLMTAQMLAPEETTKLTPNFGMIEKNLNQPKKPDFWKEVEKAESIATHFRAFHWEIEFPDAKGKIGMKFDAVITNPPWNEIRPYDEEFFSQYVPYYRSLSTKKEKDRVRASVLKDDAKRVAWEAYVKEIEQKLAFIKNSGEYAKRGSIGVAFDSWALFLERSLRIVREGGTLSLILPFGIVANGSATLLRTKLLEKRIRAFYEFENRKKIFPAVDSRYKFVLLVADMISSSEDINAAFRLERKESLEGSEELDRFVRLSKDFIRLVSPETLSIPEVRSIEDIRLCERLYKTHSLLGGKFEGWEFTIMRELGTESARLYRTDGVGWPLIDGRDFNQFLFDFEKPARSVNTEEGLRQTAKIKNYGHLNKEFHDTYRLAFRAIASSTNVRSMIACVLPQHVFTPHNAYQVLPRFRGELRLDKEYAWMICYLAGVFNSLVFDYLIRIKGATNLSFPLVYQTPLPSQFKGPVADQIVRVSAQLSCPDERFRELAEDIGVEIRPLPMGERIELTARLNALVAIHYGVTKNELRFILDSFDFAEDEDIAKLGGQVKWNDVLFRKFNGEVKKRVLARYDSVTEELRVQG